MLNRPDNVEAQTSSFSEHEQCCHWLIFTNKSLSAILIIHSAAFSLLCSSRCSGGLTSIVLQLRYNETQLRCVTAHKNHSKRHIFKLNKLNTQVCYYLFATDGNVYVAEPAW